MPSSSDTTVRVADVPADTGETDFTDYVKSLTPATIRSSLLSPAVPVPDPITTFASQHGERIATISFSSSEVKHKAIRNQRKTQGTAWRLDDRFDGLTVLKSPENADIE